MRVSVLSRIQLDDEVLFDGQINIFSCRSGCDLGDHVVGVVLILKYSKYTDEPCDGIIDYAITYDDYTYNVLIGCKEIRKGNKQAKISDKDMAELENDMVNLKNVKDVLFQALLLDDVKFEDGKLYADLCSVFILE